MPDTHALADAYRTGGGLQKLEIPGSSKRFEAYKPAGAAIQHRNLGLNAACHLLTHRRTNLGPGDVA